MSKRLQIQTGRRSDAARREIPESMSLKELAHRIAIMVVRQHRRLKKRNENRND